MFINNSECKSAVKKIEVSLIRTMKVRSMTSAGQNKEFENKQTVLKYEFKLPIAAKMPDLVAEDLIVWLTARNVNKPESCCE